MAHLMEAFTEESNIGAQVTRLDFSVTKTLDSMGKPMLPVTMTEAGTMMFQDVDVS